MDQPTNPVTFGNSLPPELQSQLEEFQRRKQLALALQQQSLQPIQPQQHGPVASRISPLAPLAQALTGYITGRTASSANQGISDLQKQYQTQTSDEIRNLQSLPENEAIKAGQLSRNPIVQALTEKMRAQREARVKEYIGAIKDYDPNRATEAARTGTIPEGSVPGAAEPEVKMVTGPNGTPVPMIVNTKKGGFKEGHFAPGGTTINLPGKLEEMAFGAKREELQARQKDAQAAMGAFQASQNAVSALQEGAKAGGGEPLKQWLRKAAQGFGIDLPETASTDQLQAALGHGVLENARKLAPVTENDIKMLAQLEGSIATDPTALSKMLAITQAASLRALRNYNDYVDTSNSGQQTPEYQTLYKGAKIGYEMPQMSGPLHHQFQTVQEYVRRGGSPADFGLEPNAKFDIHPAPVVPPQQGSAGPLTPDELKELEALRKRFGTK